MINSIISFWYGINSKYLMYILNTAESIALKCFTLKTSARIYLVQRSFHASWTFSDVQNKFCNQKTWNYLVEMIRCYNVFIRIQCKHINSEYINAINSVVLKLNTHWFLAVIMSKFKVCLLPIFKFYDLFLLPY